ncbi:hypothetical protein H4V97_002688 [Flavobacterium sp. CG_23.5]|nr:hypothetical protein [Flavobacterium sp. CG_23.5]
MSGITTASWKKFFIVGFANEAFASGISLFFYNFFGLYVTINIYQFRYI